MEIRDIGDILTKSGRWHHLQLGFFFYLGIPSALTTFMTSFAAPKLEHFCPALNSTCPPAGTECPGGMEYDNINTGITLVEEFELVCQRSWLVSLSQSMYFMGYMLAMLTLGQCSDRFGRKPLILICLVMSTLLTAVIALSPNYSFFLVVRFLQAFFRSGWFLITYVYNMEIGNVQYRNFVAFINTIGWNVGMMVTPLVFWPLPYWRYIAWLSSASFLLSIPTIWLTIESPQWLLSQGRLAEAESNLKKIFIRNHMEAEDLGDKVKQLANFAKVKEIQKKNRKTILDIFRNPQLRKNTIILYFNWMVATFSFYGLVLNMDFIGGNLYINFLILAAIEIPASYIGYWLAKSHGRKVPIIITLVLGGTLMELVIPFTFPVLGNPELLWWLRFIFAILAKLILGLSFFLLYLYTTELYPTVVRNVGIGSCSMVGRVGSILAPFLHELAAATHKGVPLGLIGGLSIASGLLFLTLPDTSDRPLQHTLDQDNETKH